MEAGVALRREGAGRENQRGAIENWPNRAMEKATGANRISWRVGHFERKRASGQVKASRLWPGQGRRSRWRHGIVAKGAHSVHRDHRNLNILEHLIFHLDE